MIDSRRDSDPPPGSSGSWPWRAGLALVVLALGVFFFLPAFIFPNAWWWRRVVRPNPLQSPIAVLDASLEGLLLEDGSRCSLAGVGFPDDPRLREDALVLLNLAAREGVEVLRDTGNACFLLCELRVWHWCGNDPVAAHYERGCLNELLIARGLGTYDLRAAGLTDRERFRLQACEAMARETRTGMWCEDQGRGLETGPHHSVSVSDLGWWARSIEAHVEELAKKDGPALPAVPR